MPAYHLNNLISVNIGLAQPLERFNEVILADVARIIYIESFEESLKHLICELVVEAQGSQEELRVVDHVVANVIDFLDHTTNGCIIKL